MNRVILHIDLDYFYVQLEELRKPELKNKIVAVGMFSGRTEDSGAIATSNYKARELGIKSGMPIAFAKKKSAELVLIPADRTYYESVSENIMELFRSFSDFFEQVSIDEAYLEVTEKMNGNYIDAKKLAEKIKNKLKEEEKLTCSIGIGPNKLIAKMASSTQKPNDLTLVTPAEVETFLRGKRISDIHGVGSKTVEALKEIGITTIPKLAETPVLKLQEMFGQNKGIMIHEKSRGIDASSVRERGKQQFSKIKTLKEDVKNAEALIEESEVLAEQLAVKASEKKIFFKTISIIVISNTLETFTRSKTIKMETQNKEKILETTEELFESFFEENPKFIVRRFGIRISNFQEPKNQKSLFDF